MSSVVDFSSRAFQRVDLDSPTVGEVALAIEGHNDHAFVLTEESTRRAVYVHPGHFFHLLGHAALEHHQSAVDTGLLDALGAAQLNVEANTSAVATARLLDAIDGSLAVVMSSEDPVGVFVPSALQEQLPHASILSDEPQGDQVISLALQGNIIDALGVAEVSFGDFHSEGINAVGPRPLECTGEGGHFVGRCPCRYHTAAPCRRS